MFMGVTRAPVASCRQLFQGVAALTAAWRKLACTIGTVKRRVLQRSKQPPRYHLYIHLFLQRIGSVKREATFENLDSRQLR